jgi:hypothetical protein
MSVVDDNLPTIDAGRQLLTDFGLRTTRVFVRIGTWDENEALLGNLTNADIELLPRPKVVSVSNGSLTVTNITPEYVGGGWAPSDVAPAIAAGQDFYFIVRGPDGNDRPYMLGVADVRSPFRFTLTLQPLTRNRPDFEVY